MSAQTTRTLNPLPFQDLEPHRFEDMVRQLAYDLREWKSIEPTGRSGADEGLDIRAIELVRADEERVEGDDEEPVAGRQIIDERLWIFQCKREKAFGPKQVRNAIKEGLMSLAAPPYGFVLAIAADVSKKARDAFRDEMTVRGISEFAIWARGELEDMLFQAKNDRLLFAYFGLSLNVSRRTKKSELRYGIAIKKQLSKLLDDRGSRDLYVLLRDPYDSRYPGSPEKKVESPRWLVCKLFQIKTPGHAVVVYREHLAALTPSRERWDAIFSYDVAVDNAELALENLHSWSVDEFSELDQSGRIPRQFWDEYIDERERASLKIFRISPFERVLAIDVIGDGWYPIPQIFIEFGPDGTPFTPKVHHRLEVQGRDGFVDIDVTDETRIKIFPEVLPSEPWQVPAEFDFTEDTGVALSGDVDAALGEVVDTLKRQRGQYSAKQNPHETKDDWAKRSKEFKKWRDAIAKPLLSSFVARLRGAGHGARVLVRSVQNNRMSEAQESIELHIKLHVGSEHNPSYWRSGFLRVALSPYYGTRLATSPPKSEDSRVRTPSGGSEVKLADMTVAQLEHEALGVIERIKDGQY